MANVRLFYGSTTGNTERVAELIKAEMGDALSSVTNIAGAAPSDLASADALILGVSTWEAGELQQDWDSFFPSIDQIDFSGKKVALFGLGDGVGFGGEFCNGLGTLAAKVKQRGGELVGSVSTEGYEFDDSSAVEGDQFVGLVIDEDNQPELTEDRVKQWVQIIQPALAGIHP